MLLLTATLLTTLSGGSARAQPAAWITVQAPPRCERAVAGLTDRARDALLGRPIAELRALVRIEAHAQGYRATLRTGLGATTRGRKQITAPTCEEAVDALIVMLALALSEQHEIARTPPPSEPREVDATSTRAASSPPAHAASHAKVPPRDPGPAVRDEPVPLPDDPELERRPERLQVSLRAGVDSGTLPVSTAVIGVGLGRSLGPLELVAVLSVGLPYVEERVTDQVALDRQRGEFGVLDLGACYGLGARLRLAACAASEVGFVRNTRLLRVAASPAVLTERVAARLAGVLTVRLAYRAGRVQPELELSGVGLALGGGSHAPRLGLRAGVGLGIQF